MSYEQKNMAGALFRNKPRDGKSLHPKAPGYQGECLISGMRLKISAWVRTAQSGEQYMSLRFEPKNDLAPPQEQAAFCPYE